MEARCVYYIKWGGVPRKGKNCMEARCEYYKWGGFIQKGENCMEARCVYHIKWGGVIQKREKLYGSQIRLFYKIQELKEEDYIQNLITAAYLQKYLQKSWFANSYKYSEFL